MLHLLTRPRLRALESPFVLPLDPSWLGHELAHVFPDRSVQHIGADLLVPTETLTAETIGVGARATVVGVGDFVFALRRGSARRLAVAAVAAPFAHDHALEQVSTAAGPVATALPVLLKLSLNRPEKIFAHQSGYINENLFL
jgi:hypothetical protein